MYDAQIGFRLSLSHPWIECEQHFNHTPVVFGINTRPDQWPNHSFFRHHTDNNMPPKQLSDCSTKQEEGNMKKTPSHPRWPIKLSKITQKVRISSKKPKKSLKMAKWANEVKEGPECGEVRHGSNSSKILAGSWQSRYKTPILRSCQTRLKNMTIIFWSGSRNDRHSLKPPRLHLRYLDEHSLGSCNKHVLHLCYSVTVLLCYIDHNQYWSWAWTSSAPAPTSSVALNFRDSVHIDKRGPATTISYRCFPTLIDDPEKPQENDNVAKWWCQNTILFNVSFCILMRQQRKNILVGEQSKRWITS